LAERAVLEHVEPWTELDRLGDEARGHVNVDQGSAISDEKPTRIELARTKFSAECGDRSGRTRVLGECDRELSP
jgi:hypothetical protein